MHGFVDILTGGINFLCRPALLFTIAIIGFYLVLFKFRERFAKPRSILTLEIGMALFLLVSMLHPTFRDIVTKGDNVPIVGMLFLLAYFFWLAVSKMVTNDRLIALGKGPENKEEAKQTVYTWPDLIFSEFICTVVVWCVLVVWSILIKAPLEEPANPVETPNPSKAPWYFLGLQEMLVYYDPWLAGVVFPGLIIVGLIVLPFIDLNPKGNGYFTFKERPFAVTTFLFGFLVLWVMLIVYGTFLRGPNWNFFGPYEVWSVHKLEVLKNVNLSEYVYQKWGLNGGRLPDNIFLREFFGFAAVLAYYLGGPKLLGKTVFKDMYRKMGAARYHVMVFLLLTMAALPIKMVFRWLFNLKYIVAIPEAFFNI